MVVIDSQNMNIIIYLDALHLSSHLLLSLIHFLQIFHDLLEDLGVLFESVIGHLLLLLHCVQSNIDTGKFAAHIDTYVLEFQPVCLRVLIDFLDESLLSGDESAIDFILSLRQLAMFRGIVVVRREIDNDHHEGADDKRQPLDERTGVHALHHSSIFDVQSNTGDLMAVASEWMRAVHRMVLKWFGAVVVVVEQRVLRDAKSAETQIKLSLQFLKKKKTALTFLHGFEQRTNRR